MRHYRTVGVNKHEELPSQATILTTFQTRTYIFLNFTCKCDTYKNTQNAPDQRAYPKVGKDSMKNLQDKMTVGLLGTCVFH